MCFRRLQKLLRLYNTSTNTELQQRSVEYDHLFQSGDSVRAGLLERMPVIEKPSAAAAAAAGNTPVTNGNTPDNAAADTEDLMEGLGAPDVLVNKHNLKQPEVRNSSKQGFYWATALVCLTLH